jgi:hypothetical protein
MKIHSPNASYSGVSASVPFKDGVGETSDPNLIGWFQDHGYTLEQTGIQMPDQALPVCAGSGGCSAQEAAQEELRREVIAAVTEPISTVGPPIPTDKPKRKRKDAAK